MKIISMYLPQFHRVKENDEWWGEGYTDWVAVKKAEKIYSSHRQPNIPLDENYYDLMEKSTMEWQADLMHKYKIDGQCFYHYWFKDGKRILERPAENLLRWKDIDMPFCFCWANETWARTWSKIQEKNEWAFRFEETKKDLGTGILLEQQYGGEKDWRTHYDYLKSFFKDERYIKYNGKPLFLIYKSRLIICLGRMLSCWNQWAIEDGFQGIYVIGANTNIDTEKCLDGILNHEPQSVMSMMPRRIEDGIVKYNYKELWDALLSIEGGMKKTYYGGFVRYDDTPRRGKGGIVVEGNTGDLFQQYLSMLIAKNHLAGNEYLFLNAWNEWGEGMYLEPDTKNGYSYLEAVKGARKQYTEYIEYFKANNERLNLALKQELDVYRRKIFRYEKYWKVFDLWMKVREQGKKIEDYLILKNIKIIGIYGVGMMGNHLIAELWEGKVEIAYAIDQRADFIDVPIKVYRPDEMIPFVDAIVVTVLFNVEEIKEKIEKNLNCKIIFLENMITSLAEGRID